MRADCLLPFHDSRVYQLDFIRMVLRNNDFYLTGTIIDCSQSSILENTFPVFFYYLVLLWHLGLFDDSPIAVEVSEKKKKWQDS